MPTIAFVKKFRKEFEITWWQAVPVWNEGAVEQQAVFAH